MDEKEKIIDALGERHYKIGKLPWNKNKRELFGWCDLANGLYNNLTKMKNWDSSDMKDAFDATANLMKLYLDNAEEAYNFKMEKKVVFDDENIPYCEHEWEIVYQEDWNTEEPSFYEPEPFGKYCKKCGLQAPVINEE